MKRALGAGELFCPVCGASYPADERFCATCKLPLVYSDHVREVGDVSATATSAPARSSRSSPRASWCGSPARATRPRPSSSRACCSRRAFPACCAAAPASTCPDFLAAGPRDVLVPETAVATAREVLLEGELINGRAACSGWWRRGGCSRVAGGAGDRGAGRLAREPGRALIHVTPPRRGARGAPATPPRSRRTSGPRKASRSAARLPCGCSRHASRAAARSSRSRTSRSITVPPSRGASRTPGGNAGRRPSRRRRAIAGRACAVWPPNQRAAPSSSHAHRSSARIRRGLLVRSGTSGLFSMITRRAYSVDAVAASISREPGTLDARASSTSGRRMCSSSPPDQPAT